MLRLYPIFLTFFGLVFLLAPVCAQQTPVAFIDVTVVPMDRERVVQHETVVVQHGRIIALGPNRNVRVPNNARRIDGRGKFLMPGMADMHVHLNVRGPNGSLPDEAEATLFIANGVTTVRNMWGNKDTLAFRRSIEQGRIIGPQIYTSGPVTDGNPPVRPLARVVQTTDEAIEAVNSDKRDGYDAIKVYDNLSPEVYQAMVSAARSAGLSIWGHVPKRVGVDGVLQSRQDSIEHVAGYLETLDGDSSRDKTADLVAATRAAGTWNCVTLVFYQNAVSREDGKMLLSQPSMQFVPPALRSAWGNNLQLAALTDYQFTRLRLYEEKRKRFVRALHDGGAKILLGTDTPNQYTVPDFSIYDELRNLVSVGLSPFEAIKTGTSDAAAFLHAQNQWGTVAVGLRADLILLRANPLQNVDNVSRRTGVMVFGRWIPQSELSKRLERLATSYTSATH